MAKRQSKLAKFQAELAKLHQAVSEDLHSYWGLWHPTGSQAAGEKDYVTTIQIFANPIEPTNQFFSNLKQILKSAGAIDQQEILISRIDCRLI